MSLQNYTTQQLEQELENRRIEREAPPPLRNPLPNFEYVIKIATEHIDDVATGEEKDYELSDTKQYIYEAVIEAIYGSEIWEWKRKRRT